MSVTQYVKMATSVFRIKRIVNFVQCTLVLGLLTMALPACKTKSGCPTSGFTNSMEKNTKGGNTQLFPKKMRKKMKKS
jgi:hypothetical protein